MRMRALAGLPSLTAVSISALAASMSMPPGFLIMLTHGLAGAVVAGAGVGFWVTVGAGVTFVLPLSPLVNRPLMKLTPRYFLIAARFLPLPPSGRGCAWKPAAAGCDRGTT